MFMPNSAIGTRECEVKFALSDEVEEGRIKAILNTNNFVSEEEQLETDFVPDTQDFLCRRHGLILRFRRIKNSKKDEILLTLKIGKTTIEGFQDAREIQYYFSEIKKELFEKINEMLKQISGLELPYEVHEFYDLRAMQKYLAEIGLSGFRTFIEKKRTIYSKDDRSVTFDIFPENIGKYMEIETLTPEELENMISLLKLSKSQVELRDYCSIVKDTKVGLSDTEQRTALF